MVTVYGRTYGHIPSGDISRLIWKMQNGRDHIGVVPVVVIALHVLADQGVSLLYTINISWVDLGETNVFGSGSEEEYAVFTELDRNWSSPDPGFRATGN